MSRRVWSFGSCCAAALTVLVGCESSTGDKDRSDACFRVRDVRSSTALHDRYVFIRAARERDYLLEISPGCIGLQFATGVAIRNDFDRVCSYSGAVITYRRFDGIRSCRILEVHAVAGLEAAEALVDQRTATDPEGPVD